MDAKIIPVDFNAFKPADFHSQWVGTEANGIDTSFLIVTRVPPGKGTPAVHTHHGDQIYFILEGEMNLQLADQHLKAKAGDLVFIPCAVPHRNWNSSDTDEIHFEFIVPGVLPGLARGYRTQWPEYELKETENAHYVRSLDYTKFDPVRSSSVTLAGYTTGSHHARVDIVRMMPSQPEAAHTHVFDKVYYTISGLIELEVGGETHAIQPNTYVYIPSGTPHAARVAGSEPAMLIEVHVPEWPAPPANVDVDINARAVLTAAPPPPTPATPPPPVASAS